MRRFHLLLSLCLLAAGTYAAERPHIVFILADDMGYDAVSANNPEGMGPLRTPHIDRLLSQGMNFTDAHTGSAVCTPTRYGFLTGRYCWRTELKKEVLWDYGRPLIKPERLTLPEFLQQQGYSTGMVGKWHLGLDWLDAEGHLANKKIQLADAVWKPQSRDRVKAVEAAVDFSKPFRGGPIDHGFHYWFGVDVPNFPPYTFCEQDRVTAIPTVPKPEGMFGSEGLMVEGWTLEPILPTLAEKACAWIHQQAKNQDGTPFFLYLSLTSPHTPIAPAEEWQGKSELTPFADFLLQTDDVVGRVAAALEQAGVADDTLLIFTTDNGTSAFRGQITKLKAKGVDLRRTLKGQKGQIHEGGHRVPFTARWPGRIPAGATSDGLLCLNDLFATFAELLGASLPEDAAEDSTSILPLLLGQKQQLADRPAVIHHDYKGKFALREGGWKLVEETPPRLYHLTTDLKETTNLAGQHPERVAAMQAKLESIRSAGRSH